MEQRLSVITLGVADLARSRAFYETGLGWSVGQAAESVVFFQLNGMVLALYPREALAADAGVPSQGSGFAGFSLAHNVRRRDEVDHVLAEAERAGGRVVKPAQETFWGGYSGYVADPDGHLWEVAHNPFWAMDAAGSVSLATGEGV
ncbi:VOC family protein [Guyparkeria hydrothermalis]|uniref:VOC family protein n=1 Tax=Guyparkeria TaxID=2035712 RepID=UPI0010AC0304|nr:MULTISPECIES: VOC family protein [Guyparkeria]MCL7751519.1 VOC family protein [Guyparkeria hydrothermalis]TKA90537.1 VOC family protein [Guyparkeria sp. SB14A]